MIGNSEEFVLAISQRAGDLVPRPHWTLFTGVNDQKKLIFWIVWVSSDVVTPVAVSAPC